MRKKEIKNNNIDRKSNFEEMEKAEEFGDGWFAAGVATGILIGVSVIALT